MQIFFGALRQSIAVTDIYAHPPPLQFLKTGQGFFLGRVVDSNSLTGLFKVRFSEDGLAGDSSEDDEDGDASSGGERRGKERPTAPRVWCEWFSLETIQRGVTPLDKQGQRRRAQQEQMLQLNGPIALSETQERCAEVNSELARDAELLERGLSIWRGKMSFD